MIDPFTNLPPGVLPSDLDREERDCREDEEYFESLWNHAERYAQENER